MNRLEKWLLQRLCRKLVVQGYDHKANITEFYAIMRNAIEQEFTEDNQPTRDAFIADCQRATNA